MIVYIKKVEGLTVPFKSSEVAAGYDIIATSGPKIVGTLERGGERYTNISYIEYETNIFISPSKPNLHCLIHPRSSISKYNLTLANSIGLIDNDYRGMLLCRFKYNWQPEDYSITSENKIVGNYNHEKIYKMGDKIAQLVFENTLDVTFELVDDLSETSRNDGGFGSTDKQQLSDILNGIKTPKLDTEEDNKEETPASNILKEYSKFGGVKLKERYIDEIKKRNAE